VPRQIPSSLLMFINYRAAEDRIFSAVSSAGFQGITRAQARLVAGIDADGTRLVVLAERARIAKQTANALVNGLEEAGYVERVPDPTDGRARLVRLTARGRAGLPHAQAEEARIEAEWEAQLGRRRMQAMREALWELALLSDPQLEPPTNGRADDPAVQPSKRRRATS
jgi:DNA-binding MarR family transcriptional regulator